MRKQGTVVRWDATRAFGFIRSPDTAADVFFHVRDFRGAGAPQEGMAVAYEEIHVGGKGPRAMAVQPLSAQGFAPPGNPSGASRRPRAAAAPRAPAARATQPAQPAPSAASARRAASRPKSSPRSVAAGASAAVFWVLVLAWLALLGWGIGSGRLPALWTVAAAFAVNLVTVWTYASDKNAAIQKRWRTREDTLHLFSLLGGWPGARLAQWSMRHKSSKQSFQVVYWLTVVLHCAGLAFWVMGPVR